VTDERDYLWDPSAPPDPEIRRLEDLLRPLGHAGDWRPRRPRRPVVVMLAAAALVLMCMSGVWLLRPGARSGWEVSRVAGSPRINQRAMDTTARLPVGGWLETDGNARARIAVGAIGVVTVDPGTRVGLRRARALEHRLALERGRIHAFIWAPPRLFVVDTPSAVATDLGCMYSLEVDATGAGYLRVESGWVGFENRGLESFVPMGAACRTRPGRPPGTPFFEDSTPALQQALTKLDFEPLAADARGAALATVLRESRPRDALTLWHLLARTSREERPLVYDRLAGLVEPPAGVTREGVLAGNHQMLDRWWNQFGLDSVEWWRIWKRPWTGQ
jgi:hypothetical protein